MFLCPEDYVIAIATSSGHTEKCYVDRDTRWSIGKYWDLLGQSYECLYLARKGERLYGKNSCIETELRQKAELLMEKWRQSLNH